MIRIHNFSGWRRNLQIEMIPTHLGTCRFFLLPIPVTVYRITGERDLGAAAEATATDLPPLLVGEESTYPQARTATQNVLNDIATRKETIAGAVTWLINAFPASVVNHNRPHATEPLSFGGISQKTLLRTL